MYSVDLDSAMAAHGLIYGANVKLRFNQYGSHGGLGLDDVRVLKLQNQRLRVTLPSAMNEGAMAQGTVFVSPMQPVPLSIVLASSDSTAATVPATVQIPANTASASFSINAPNDSLLEGSQSVSITASAPTFVTTTAAMDVHDAQTATLSLTVPPNANERVSYWETWTVQGTLSLSAPPAQAVQVALLTSSDDLWLPQFVEIPAGATSATFKIAVGADFQLEGPETVSITAHVANWIDATATITIADLSTSLISLSVPAPMTEGDSATGFIQREGSLQDALVVSLASSDPSVATAPATVTFAAGTSFLSFPITAVQNTVMGGPQSVTFTASADGMTPVSKTLTVADNEVHHFSFSAFSPAQIRNAPIEVTITAQSISDDTITNYTGAVTLTAGGLPISPASVTLVGGKWTGTIAIGADSPLAFLLAENAAGVNGLSDGFSVALGTLHHFAINGVGTQKFMDAPFPLTVSAVDAGGNVISGYNGPVAVGSLARNTRAQIGIPAPPTNGHPYDSGSFITRYPSFRVETAYHSGEIGLVGLLGSVAINFTEVPPGTYKDFTIRLKHFASGSSNYSSDYGRRFEPSGWTEVYRGDLTVTATGWLEFPFSTAFDYNGASDLMFDFSFYNPDEPDPPGWNDGRYETTRVSDYRCLTDTGFSDLKEVSAFPNGTHYLPNVRFSSPTFTPTIRPTGPVTVVNGTWTGSASVPFVANSVQITASDGGTSGKSTLFSVQTPLLPPGAGVISREDWEANTVSTAWQFSAIESYSYNEPSQTTQISNTDGPHGGAKHLTFDRMTPPNFSSYISNQATWTNDLTGQRGLTLKFWVKGFSEISNAPRFNNPLSPDEGFDGVSMSADGTNWYEIIGLRNLSNSWAQYTVDLDAAIRARGLAYGTGFKIRFNQFRYYSARGGIAIDDIELISTPPTGALLVTLPAQVSEGGANQTGTVGIPFAVSSNVNVTLNSNAAAKVIVPSYVIIPAGQTSASFSIQAPDDLFIDGDKTVSITAAAPNYITVGKAMMVLDNDIPALTLTVPTNSVAENGAPISATLTLAAPASAPITFAVTSSDGTAITVPSSVTISAMSSSAVLSLSPVNDTKIDGSQTATVTVSRVGLPLQNVTITVLDNETGNLRLVSTISPEPTTAAEGTDATQTSFTVSLSGTLTSATTVTFTSSSSRVTAPAAVTIPAGSTSAAIAFSVVDNALSDGAELVTLTASAPGLTSAIATRTVQDNEVHHFDIGPIASPQVAGAQTAVTITAKDAAGTTVSGYSGTLSMAASATVSPATVSGFSGGVWSGNLRFLYVANGVVLSVNDGSGHSGASNAFDVSTGPFIGYTWDAIGPVVAPGAPIPITIRATDAGGNTFPANNESVTVRAMIGAGTTTVGGGADSWPFIFYTYPAKARSQTLFLASELGGSRTLSGFTWTVSSGASGKTLSNFTVRVKPTTRTSFDFLDDWENDGWTVVHQSALTISANGPLPISFDTPYDYDAQSNLMIDVSFSNTATGDSVYWKQDSTSSDMTRYGSTNSVTTNPLQWTNASVSGSTTYDRIYTQFHFLQPANAVVSSPTALTGGVLAGTVTFAAAGYPLFMEVFDASGTRALSNRFRVSPPPNGADNTAPVQFTLPPTVAESGVPVTATVAISAASASDTVIGITSSSPQSLVVPAQVTILAGQTSAAFSIAPQNNSARTGPVTVSLTATLGATYAGLRTTQVLDDEAITMTLILPASVTESDTTLRGVVTISPPPENAQIISLSSSLIGALTVPAQVTCPAGQSNAPFTATLLDDSLLNGTRTVTVTAAIANWASTSATVTVNDNENLSPSIDFSSVYENSTGSGTVRAGFTLLSPLVIALTSSDPTHVTVPATVTIPAGANSASITTSAPNNTIYEGKLTATITATFPDSTVKTAQVTINDDDPPTVPHHFSLSPIGASVVLGKAFSVTVTAETADGTRASGYAGNATLSSVAGLGSPAFTPGSAIFSNGTATFSVTMGEFANGVQLVASGDGITATSTPFNVITGPVDHYRWSTIASPQIPGRPFNATITAVDAGGNLVTNTSGYLLLTGVSTKRTIGSGLSTSTLFPLGANSHDQRTQVIYSTSQLGTAPITLSSIALYVEAQPGQPLNAWTIRIKNGTSYGTWDATGWTTVYSANKTISETGWVDFVFTTPFNYSGTSSVLVDFSFNNTTASTAGRVRTFISSGTTYASSNSLSGDPRAWFNNAGVFGPNPLTSSSVPQAIFNMAVPPLNSPNTTAVLMQNGTWTGSLTLPNSIGGGPLIAKDFAGISGTSNVFTMNAANDNDTDRLPDWWETANGPASGNSTLDPDYDGLSNFLEYALNSNPNLQSPAQLPAATVQTNPADGLKYLTFSYRRRIGILAVSYIIQTSADCLTWTPDAAAYQETGAAPLDDGVTEQVTVRVLPAISAGGGRFVRLKVTAP